MGERTTTIGVYVKDAELLWNLRGDRDVIPKKKKPGKGRRPSEKETFAEVFTRAVNALRREQEG